MELNKTKLKRLLKDVEQTLAGLRAARSYRIDVAPALRQCEVLATWLKAHPLLGRGARYAYTLAAIRRTLRDHKEAFGRGRMAETYEKQLRELLRLLQAIDGENKNVFVVYGHDAAMRDEVQALLTALGVPWVVLAREAHTGQTVMEQFEREAARCEYAVVLCSADDEGRRLPAPGGPAAAALRPRARQHVVLELGYFLARLGRQNLFVMHSAEALEQPTDFVGVTYETYDAAGRWQARLAAELRRAGLYLHETVLKTL